LRQRAEGRAQSIGQGIHTYKQLLKPNGERALNKHLTSTGDIYHPKLSHSIQEKVYNPLPFFILFSNFNQLNTNYQSFFRHAKPKSGTNSTGPH
jgi:hypothetical protein